jgi:hypothetical protein
VAVSYTPKGTLKKSHTPNVEPNTSYTPNGEPYKSTTPNEETVPEERLWTQEPAPLCMTRVDSDVDSDAVSSPSSIEAHMASVNAEDEDDEELCELSQMVRTSHD